MPDTRFILVRHASTDALGHVLSGRSDTALNTAGLYQARRLANRLAQTPVTAILASPQLRTQQTAAAIAFMRSLPVQTEPALDEIDFGAWTGQDFPSLSPRPDWQAWNTLRSLAPAAETMLHAQGRAIALLQHLRAAQPGGTCVLVTHADIVKAVLSYLLGMPTDLMHRLDIAPASSSTIVLGETTVKIESMNLTTPEG